MKLEQIDTSTTAGKAEVIGELLKVALAAGDITVNQAREVMAAVDGTLTPQWQPIETAPREKNVLMVWRPIDADKRPWHVEVVIALVSSYEEGSIWISGRYQPMSHVSHWMPLPAAPEVSP